MGDFQNWNQQVNQQGGGSAPRFNVGAAEFVPNFNAPAFVPGQQWSAPAFTPAAPAPAPAAVEAPVPAPAPAAKPEPVEETEDWEAQATKEEVTETAKAEAPKAEETPKAEEAPKEDTTKGDTSKKNTETKASAAAAAPTEEDDDDDDDDDTTEIPLDILDKREHLNIVFIGHVDAGKSTIGGQLMFLTGNVDKRTLEKYERESREKNRESWYLSWAMDTNEEERAKGKTVECGQGHFTTENKHFTVIDAPGHKSFVPNMISGAAQADVAVLVISARKGEFETGFERGGQTREHAMLVKTAGVHYLIVVINKMDDPTVEWDVERYNECKDKLNPFLKQCGFKKDEVYFLPVSGFVGVNLTEPAPKGTCDWYTGPALIPLLDSLPKLVRLLDHPFRMPISDKYNDMGTMVMGKVQSGFVRKGQTVALFPNKNKVSIDSILVDDEESDSAQSGDNVKLKLKGISEDAVNPGYVLCARSKPCHVCTTFDAQLVVLEWKSIICPGFNAVLHIHSATEEVILKGLICHVSKKTGKPDKEKGRPRFIKQGDVAIVRLTCNEPVCIETFKDHPHMGRFTLRDEGKTLAIGKVLKLIDPRE